MEQRRKAFLDLVGINTDILEQLHSGIALFDRTGMLLYANKAYVQMYAFGDKPYLGMRAEDLFVTAQQGLMEVFKTGKTVSCTSVTVDGRYGVTYRYPLKDARNEIIGCLTENISVALDKARILEMQGIIDSLENQDGFSTVLSPAQSVRPVTFDSIVGECPAMRLLKNKGKRFALHDEPILILGENGTGKDLLAQAIHAASTRRGKNFITVNCAALPHELMESELFGYEAGAFTGAKSSGKKGKFEAAEGGTVFLDEIGELPLSVQAKLLRVLESHEIQKLGSARSAYVDFRLLSATNRNLEQMVEQGLFREDLYYRLNLFDLTIPPLRERLADIPLLAYSMLHSLLGLERGRRIRISSEVLSVLSTHEWRGNVRELRNVITYALYCMGPHDLLLNIHHLPERFFSRRENDFLRNTLDMEGAPLPPAPSVSAALSRRTPSEAEAIRNALRETGGNKAKAARLLGMARSNLYKKLAILESAADTPGV